ncbi:sigma-54-dependent transcriptional regulator [Alienimonas chondri]|uniref:DNA-binding transcriptional regulator NtrC n=1 Tax=Alienimonas chondri TaxID=2681879 RepID=A0ABX1VAQ4_9PLAN|nr:sigma-54 dependent transcriptional regulator [Alienimonas chondri]NNJ24814.1 Regulatory protein AtoC [Alienimonas chondri]
MPRLLVIDDDRSVPLMVRRAVDGLQIGGEPVEVSAALTASDGLRLASTERPDVVLLDLVLPGAKGRDLFDSLHKEDPKRPVLFVTAGGTSDTAIEAMKQGAFDYLLKPLDLPKLRELLTTALESRRLMSTKVGLSAQAGDSMPTDLFIGRTESAVQVYKSIGLVAAQDVTVLVRGESGTGKELVARAIYHHGKRQDKPFMAINCAAIPDALLESELFGHEKGAFTGADRQRIGKFEQCSGGTIFLDEIGDTTLPMQAKMLRLLQEQRFERVGGNVTIKTDVRVIAATNRPLEAMVDSGEFRGDLFFRLNEFSIDIPPLRERGDDVLLLVEFFLSRFKRELGQTELEGIAPEAVTYLRHYAWPGNVRELQSVLRKAILHSSGPVIVPKDLPAEVRGGTAEPPKETGPPSDLRPLLEGAFAENSDDIYADSLELMERYVVTRILDRTGGNQSRAAKMLGITRGSLRNKIRGLGITIEQVIGSDD